jgi:predicted DsbA family dithiol-disulfide isomerase
LQKEYEVIVHWRAFPLHPETPQEGRLLEDLFKTSPEKIAGMLEHLRKTADELGLPFTTRTRTYNSRLAQELGLWAIEKGKGDAFHVAVFKAYFSSGLNIGKHSVLIDLVREIGLPVEEAEEILYGRVYAEKVDKDWADSQLKGITAVPTFVMGQHKLIGAQKYESLADLVTLYGTDRKMKTL